MLMAYDSADVHLKLCHQKTGRGEQEMSLTHYYPGNKHAHVGTQRTSPEQTQSTVSLPGTENNK